VPIDVEVSEHVAVVTLNRPDRMNALDADMYAGLTEAWMRVRDDDEIRAAIVTGAGDKAFCAGADLKSLVNKPAELGDLWKTQQGLLLNRGLEVWKPVIAAVNGYCLAGGMTLLLATDIRVATPSATFGLPEVGRGILAGNGGTQRVLEQLPHAVGMELLLTGDPITAEDALRWGLVNKVVAPGALMEAAWGYARKIARQAPLAVQASKELALRSRELGASAGLRIEQALGRLLQFSDDAAEGPAAFAEGRPPEFRGR
jgi:E-phenylitaconyl-CoA hydratase